ncbi:hypothetical protein RF11_15514 [Thelohanellus kitauei]|uniref:Uncharacterized protein n=1 Tax=Thelohanellus kitauei TaxID=669202 RepID=A0A0C2J4U2_THEKT|nr:hypothetical protein RF11_15514 [Thelohanellus kitauei]
MASVFEQANMLTRSTATSAGGSNRSLFSKASEISTRPRTIMYTWQCRFAHKIRFRRSDSACNVVHQATHIGLRASESYGGKGLTSSSALKSWRLCGVFNK